MLFVWESLGWLVGWCGQIGGERERENEKKMKKEKKKSKKMTERTAQVNSLRSVLCCYMTFNYFTNDEPNHDSTQH